MGLVEEMEKLQRMKDKQKAIDEKIAAMKAEKAALETKIYKAEDGKYIAACRHVEETNPAFKKLIGEALEKLALTGATGKKKGRPAKAK